MNFIFNTELVLVVVVIWCALFPSAHGKYVPISTASDIPESRLIAILKIVPSKQTVSENSNLESSAEPSDFLNAFIFKSVTHLQSYIQDNPDKDVDFVKEPSPNNDLKEHEDDDQRSYAFKILFYIVFTLIAFLTGLLLITAIQETFCVDSRTKHCLILDRINKLENNLERISIPAQSTTSSYINVELEKHEIKLRERNLIIKNLPEDAGETNNDCVKLVKNFLNDELGPEYGDIQIKGAYRLGNDRYLNINNKYTRFIKVILNSSDERDGILIAGQDILRRKKSKVYIFKDLPPATRSLIVQEHNEKKLRGTAYLRNNSIWNIGVWDNNNFTK